MFHVITFLTVSLVFSTPLLVLAQRGASPEALQRRAASQKREVQAQPQTETTLQLSVKDQARQDAHKDVNTYVNRPMWFIIGCIFPAVGLLAPYFYKPPIPASSLLGKSPEYVAYYTDAYNQKRQSVQFSAALAGQGVGCCLFGLSVALQASR